MPIIDTIKSMQTHTQNAYEKIKDKGGVIPTNKNLENLSDSIESISAGGFTPEYVKFGNYTGSVLTLKGLDTSKVTTMDSMFFFSSGILNLDLSNFNTFNVTTMSSMFYGCNSLTSLDLSSFNTWNVADMSSMFASCSSLTSLNITNFNTSNVTNMFNMFASCNNLTSLDLSSFDTTNVTNMDVMFDHCTNLTKLDISNFDFSNVTSYSEMFRDVQVDCEILVKDETAKTWITSKFSTLTNVQIKS